VANALLVTNEAAVNRALLLQTTLAASKLRLLKSYTPAYTDDRATLIANEADFTGYTSGGYALTAWTGPALPGTGGASITSPLVTVAPSGGNVVSNDISGFWIEDASTPTPKVFLLGTFSPFITVLNPTDQFPIIVQDYEGVAVSPL
jgi:hypothetical protein